MNKTLRLVFTHSYIWLIILTVSGANNLCNLIFDPGSDCPAMKLSPQGGEIFQCQDGSRRGGGERFILFVPPPSRPVFDIFFFLWAQFYCMAIRSRIEDIIQMVALI